MTRARKPFVRLVEAELFEAFIPGNGKPHKVDREQGIIYGVKVVGKSSPNTHGVRNVEGTDYTEQALKGAISLYEGIKVNVDHPSREKPNADRSAYDRIGKLVNVRIEEGELYADLKLLTKHPLAERLMEAAEKMPDCFGLSHNGYGKGAVKGDRYVITEIPEVRSVDVVADAGTVSSLFESRHMKKKTLKSVLESMKVPAPLLKQLWEMDGMDPTMASTDMPPAPEEGEEGYEAHLGKMIVAIVNDEELSPEDKKKKVLAALKLMGEEEAPETPATPTEESDEEPGKKDDEEDDDKDKKEAKESRDLAAELDRLKRKDQVRDLCESLEYQPSKIQLKALLALDTDAERKTFINESKAQGGKKPGSAPRSGGARPLTESSEKPLTTKEFATSICD